MPAGPGVTLTGNAVPGSDCFNVASAATTVVVGGSEGHRTITLPSASAPGFPGLVFGVNPDGSIDADVNYSPPGAPGASATFRFRGQFTSADRPTPWSVTGTLTTSGGGVPDCTVQYDATGQAGPTPSTSTTAPSDNTTTYGATFGMANSADGPGSTRSADCARSFIFIDPFAITIHVRHQGSGRDQVTVVGGGYGGDPIALYNPLPTANATGRVSDSGTFNVGGNRAYDNDAQGEFSSHWSGDAGSVRNRPAEFLLRIHQTWVRNRDIIHWLAGSGGHESFDCSYDVMAIRQA